MNRIDNEVKKYFAMKGSVIKWWNPQQHSIFRVQFRKIGKVINPKGKVIADIGTGDGRFAIYYALQGAKRVYALDISKEMLEVAKKNAKEKNVYNKIVFLHGDIENITFRKKFDIVSCMELLVHFQNQQKVMDKLAKITKNGGIVAVNIDLPHTDLFPINYHLYWRKWEPFFAGYQRFKTTRATVNFLKKHPRARLFLAKDALNKISKEKFVSLFKNSGLKVFKIVREGYWFFPKGYIIFGKK